MYQSHACIFTYLSCRASPDLPVRCFDLGCGGLPSPRDSFPLWLVGPAGPRVSFPTSAVVGGARGSSGFIPDFGPFFRWGPRVLSHLPLFLYGQRNFILYLFFCFSLSLSFILHVVIISTHFSSAFLLFLLYLYLSLFPLCFLSSVSRQTILLAKETSYS